MVLSLYSCGCYDSMTYDQELWEGTMEGTMEIIMEIIMEQEEYVIIFMQHLRI